MEKRAQHIHEIKGDVKKVLHSMLM